MNKRLENILQRVGAWPDAAQDELAQIVAEIEDTLSGSYKPSADELRAIDEADGGGLATEAEIKEAFRSFRSS